MNAREDGAVSCPKDQTPMERLDLAGVAIDRCPGCGGIWLDAGELRAILDAGGVARHQIESLEGRPHVEPQHRPQPLLCPRDHSRMSVHHDPHQKHIEFDLCSKCGGVFFDAGELADLSRFTIGERLKGLLG
ncbi:MAG: zf-TFIIB domain-containing protein [Phycisphaerales bacterium]